MQEKHKPKTPHYRSTISKKVFKTVQKYLIEVII